MRRQRPEGGVAPVMLLLQKTYVEDLSLAMTPFTEPGGQATLAFDHLQVSKLRHADRAEKTQPNRTFYEEMCGHHSCVPVHE